MKNTLKKIRAVVRRAIAGLLSKCGYVRKEKYLRPYIIQKSTEGVDFLFHIKDQHARLWYDLYCTDPVWLEMRFIKDNLITPGGIAIECGSHHGATAIMLSHWVGPKGKVYAYEPGKVNFGVLVDNIKLNAIQNIFPIHAAVGAQDGFVGFDEYPDESMGSRVHTHGALVSSIQTYTVKQVSLDSHAPEKPTLIKIDTQGYVYQPLLGLKNIIRDQRPNLALEIDGIKAISKYGENFYKIFELIEHEDYEHFVAFNPREYPKQISLNSIVGQWKALNGLSGDIHLFAKNRRRVVN